MFDKRFQKELELIENAQLNEINELECRRYFSGLIKNVVRQYAKKHFIKTKYIEALMSAGWKYFPQASRNYIRHAHDMMERRQDLFYFGTYFTWYIRQGVIDYLQESTHP